MDFFLPEFQVTYKLFRLRKENTMGNFDVYLKIALNSVAVYLFIIVAIRLFGKKELAQLTIIDLTFILLISNSVQNAMVGPDSTLT